MCKTDEVSGSFQRRSAVQVYLILQKCRQRQITLASLAS